MITAKMRVESIIPSMWGGSTVQFRADYDDKIAEDKRFQKATPTADARFAIDNPAAISQLVVGGTYYFDIVPADARTAEMVSREKIVSELRARVAAGGAEALQLIARHMDNEGGVNWGALYADPQYASGVNFKALPAEHTEGPHPVDAELNRLAREDLIK